jgi:hypothetical protein
MVERDLAPAHDQLQRLLATHGGCFRQSDVVGLMGLQDASTLDRWRKNHQIVAIQSNSDEWLFPIWQFARKHRRIMLGIRDCLAELAFEEESEPIRFFLSRMDNLGGHSPLDRLRAGKIEAAIMAARHYSHQS